MRAALIPHDEADRAWSALAAAICDRVGQVPREFKRRWPELPQHMHDMARELVDEALAELERDPLSGRGD